MPSAASKTQSINQNLFTCLDLREKKLDERKKKKKTKIIIKKRALDENEKEKRKDTKIIRYKTYPMLVRAKINNAHL